MTYTNNQIADSVNRIIKFYEKNKRLPNYIMVGNDKLTIKQYIALTQLQNSLNNAKAFCTKNKRMANTVSICGVNMGKELFTKLFNYQCTSTTTKTTTSTNNTSTMYTQKGLYTKSLGQNTNYYCCPNSCQKTLYKLTGKIFKQSTLAKVLGTTTKGTAPESIKTLIAWYNKKYNAKLSVKLTTFNSLGKTDVARFEALGKLMSKSNVAVFHRLGYQDSGSKTGSSVFGHYEVPYQIDTKNKTVTVLNSLGTKSGSGYVGHIQKRSYALQKNYLSKRDINLIIITKG